jgi:pyruvate dehydrogenase E1 component alpha subunit/2-oxoisovalerate dehydrogenase E1 component alpha subunit
VSRRATRGRGSARDRKTAKAAKAAKPSKPSHAAKSVKAAKTTKPANKVKRLAPPPKARKAKPAPRPTSKPSKRRAPAPDPMRPTDEPIRLLAPDGEWLGGAAGPPLPPEILLALFQGMLRVRLLDGRMLNLQRQGRIGFYGQCTGQEAAIIGSASALEARDWVAPALREAGVAVWRGLPLARLIAQCMAKDNEISHGRQMPCHHTFRAGNFVAMSSVIATQLLHATGIALAAKIRRDPIVCVGYLGDGATSEHDFHSALNFAGVYRAPVVFLCQNNQWAISVPVSRQTAAKTLAVKALSYGMPGVRVDGNDVLAVHFEVKRAVERARGGGGPTFVEALTYRRLGHSSSDDPTRYRSADEVKKWERLDPIDRLRRHLTARGLLTKAKEEALEEEIQAAISAAITEAEAGVEPAVETLVTDVFAEPTPQLLEQRDALLAYLRSRGTDPEVERNHG